MSNQDNQNDFSTFIVEYILQPVQNNTIGYGTINFDKLKNGDFSEFSAPMSNAMKFAASLYHVTAYETLASFKVKNDEVASLKKIDGYYTSVLHNFAWQKHTIQISIEQINNHISQAKSTEKIAYWNNAKAYFERSLSDIEKNATQALNAKNLDTSLIKSSSQEILDKIGGDGYAKEFLGKMDKAFNYANFFRQATATVSLNESSSEADIFNYTAGWFNVLSGFADNSILSKVMPVSWSDKALSLLPSMSSKAIVASIGKGVITGIIIDVTYKATYEGAKWFFSEIFDDLFGQELYEMDWFIEKADSFYSTIFSHLTADKLNAVIAFNTMILGNFVNEQGKSVIEKDTVILFGSDDYKSMDFDKALKSYKKLYKAVSGKDDAKNITGAEELIRHMEGSYLLFKEYRGKLLNILQGLEDTKELFTLSQGDDETALAYRYALANLNPFVLMDIDYTKHNPNGELDLYHAKTNPNGLTPIYLEKRAEMMSVMMDKMTGKFIQNKYNYQDLAENISVNETSLDGHHGNIDTYNDNTQVIFGGTGHDTIKAKDTGDNNNFLFGGAGHDIIIGGKGNDYLEGGQGFDTYHIKDHDTIFDADGKGHILFDNKPLPTDFILKQGSSGIWEAKDSAGNVLYTAIREANDLVYQNIA